MEKLVLIGFSVPFLITCIIFTIVGIIFFRKTPSTTTNKVTGITSSISASLSCIVLITILLMIFTPLGAGIVAD